MGSSKVSIRAKLKNIFHKAPDTNADLQVDRKEDEYRKGAALASISSLNKSRPQSEFHDHDNKSVVMAHNGPYDGKTEDPQSLWDRAYDALDPRLVAKYEKLLSRQIPSTGLSSKTTKRELSDEYESLDETDNRIQETPQNRQETLDKIIKDGLRRMNDQKTKYHIAGHEFALQDQVADAAKLVEEVKDFISTAVAASPQASLAWAGVCIILPILTNPSAAEQANKGGFAYVTSRMRYYVTLEPLLWPQKQQTDRSSPGIDLESLKREVEALIVDLYQHILDFQLRSVLRFYRSWRRNFPRDAVRSEKWEDMLNTIKDLELTVDTKFKGIAGYMSRKYLEDIGAITQESYGSLQRLLSVAEAQRVILSQQLWVQEQIANEILSQDEKKCRQLFRLMRDEQDNSYEWYKNHVGNRVEGTCQWFLKQSHFETWLKRDTGLLIVSADPGCGKSVLAQYLIDQCLPELSVTVCYFFFKDEDQNTLKQALCALLHQLFCHKPSLIRHAMPHYLQNGSNLLNVSALLWDILIAAGRDAEAGRIIFVVDALDECKTSDFREFSSMLNKQIYKEKSESWKVRFLLTSRPYTHIISEFQVLMDTFPHIHIPGEGKSEEISQEVNLVIKHRVNQLAKEKKLSTEVTEHLQQRLLENQHRTYLWVYLIFDYLKTQDFRKTKKGIDSIINTLPQTVNQAYEKILSKSTSPSVVHKALCMVLASYRPLTLREMNVAINVDINSKSWQDLDLETDEDFKKSLRSWCGLFILIDDDKVHFLHQTARDFLLRNGTSQVNELVRVWNGSISSQEAHSVLAQSCIIYLDKCVSSDDSGHKFLDYSASYWPNHYQDANWGKYEQLDPAVLRICDPDMDICQYWFCTNWSTSKAYDYYEPPEKVSSLLIASFLGLDRILKQLLDVGKVHPDSKDSGDHTPLSWAAFNGHDKVVQLLLDSGNVNADSQSLLGRTPLSIAAERGSYKVVKILLNTGKVDINGRDFLYEMTPLAWAVVEGHEVVIKMLLDTLEVDVNSQDSDGRTPLSYAVRYGMDKVVGLLLNTGKVNVNHVDFSGLPPLSWAATEGLDKMVQLLLNTENIDVNLQDRRGRTPLFWAVYGGEQKVVKLLLETRKVDMNVKDHKFGQAVLAWASEQVHHEIFQLLLDTAKVDLDSKDKEGRTPLVLTAMNGHEAVVELLEQAENMKQVVKGDRILLPE